MSGTPPSVAKDDGRPSKFRRVARLSVLFVVQLVVLLAILEVASVFLYPVVFAKPFSRERLRSELLVDAETEESPPAGTSDPSAETTLPTSQQILHPYVGYVRDTIDGVPTNTFGFFGDPPILKRNPDRVNVALLGGSVALHMSRHAGDVLERTLERLPAFAGKEIALVTLALPGYKQPQQLMALTYMLYLGAQYDVVINLDGFNEVALPFTENHPQRIFHHHPRLWGTHASAQQSPKAVSLAGEIIGLREEQEQLRSMFSSPTLHWSRFALLLWKGLDRQLEGRIRELDATYRTEAGADQRPLGPIADYGDDFDPYFQRVATAWARASRQIQFLSDSHRFQYFHFLQPNQYVPDSKPLSPQEMRVAHIDGYPGEISIFHRAYRFTVEKGYPLLKARGRRLRAEGIDFVDLTLMFEDVRRPLYDDLCCHFNLEGYRRLASGIGEKIGEKLRARAAVGTTS